MDTTPTALSATPSRRTVLAALSAGALVLWAPRGGVSAAARVSPEDGEPWAADLFLTLAPDGAVTIVAHRSEMGTGIRTALPQVLADELGADWQRVTLRQATGDPRYGDQNTDGSRSVRQFFERMREIGATARTLLERAAAERLGVDPAQCRAADHAVHHADSGRALPFGELVARAATLPVPTREELRFKTAAERTLIGRDLPLADLQAILTGSAVYGLDVRRPGQWFAVIAHPPVLGATVKELDDTAARAVPGVQEVLTLPRFEGAHGFQPLGGVAVLADNTYAALQGRRALQIQWSTSEHDGFDSTEFAAELSRAARAPGKVWRSSGDASAAFAAAAPEALAEADYYTPLLAHAPMEPPAALAEVSVDDEGRATACRAWAATQNPQAARDQVAATLGLAPEAVTVEVTLLGGGFGRKSKPDYVAEAAYLSRAVRRPVHVTWTREDDLQQDYYHTTAAVHLRAVIGERGLPSAWLQRSAFPPIGSTFVAGADEPSSMELHLGFTDLPYAVPHLQIESARAAAHVRIGWLRSVSHVYHALAVCGFADELARRAGRDPLEYLLELLGPDRELDLAGVDYPNQGETLERYPFDVARLKHVTRRAAELAGWGRELPRGRGLGIACHRSFLSYYATVVEVDVTRRGELTIPAVWSVIDAGTVVNPDRVRAQMEGAAVFGASLALYGEITARAGRIEQSNFHQYGLARIFDAPRALNCEIVPSEALPGGVGETGVPPFAPALLNAICAATGVRVRQLPLSKADLSWR
jgi:isoquinoline 1-oxidoreductase beta subunit